MKTIKNISALGLVGAMAFLSSACVPEDAPDEGSGQVSSSAVLGGREFTQVINEESLSLAASSVETAGCEVSDMQREMLELVNKARAEGQYCGETYHNPLPPLTWNCSLVKAAEIHNDDMVQNNFFAHEGSDGLKAGSRLDRVGYNWGTYGENLAAGYIEPADAVEALLKSPGHCRNIMGARYKEFGAASVFYTEADYSHYWSQVFGTEL